MTSAPFQEFYGLNITGVDGGGETFFASGATAPGMDVRHARLSKVPVYVGPQRAVLDLPEDRQVRLERAGRSATFTGLPPSHDELIHPYLGAAACVFARWADYEVFHAGAFVSDDLAWVVIGTHESGKSSLLAALAARGLPVLSDDLVVTDGHQAFCGPRTIDLREPRPGTDQLMRRVRDGSRWRITLPEGRSAVPLGGWIYLRWRQEVAVSSVSASERLARLAARRSWPTLPSNPETVLALAAVPGWQLERPADWDRMDEATDRLLQTVATASLQGPSLLSNSPAWLQPSKKVSTSCSAAVNSSP